MLRSIWLSLALIVLVLLGASPKVHADDYPNRPITLIVPFPPGGSTTVMARNVADKLSLALGQQIVVENRGGAGGTIGTRFVAKAAPDGYTILLANPANAVNATLYKHLNFVFLRDLEPVAGFIRVTNVMEVNPDVPAKTVAEFIAYAKANPGKVNMASSGNGTSVHLSGELFMAMTGVKMQHVPYKGAAPALTDLMGGQVQVLFDNLPSSIEHIKAGKLRALGVTAAQRSSELPDVPTVGDTVPGYEASAFFGLVVPKGTPKEIVEKINGLVNDALKDPKMLAKLKELGGRRRNRKMGKGRSRRKPFDRMMRTRRTASPE
jgi:tripartite-type tricarboxylate transporter receptor subunit TctC